MKGPLQIYLPRPEKWFKLGPAHHGYVISPCIKQNSLFPGKTQETLEMAGEKGLIRKETAQDNIWIVQLSCCISFSPHPPTPALNPKLKHLGQWSIRELLVIADNTKLICTVFHLLETLLLWLCIPHASMTDRNNEKIGASTEQLCLYTNVSPSFLPDM